MRRIAFSFIAIVTLFLSAGSLLAQAAPGEQVDPQKVQEYIKLEQELARLFPLKDFAKIGEVCRKQIELFPKSAEPHYNLACSMARLGQKEPALKELALAIDLGFVDDIHISEDEDLATLHDDPRFKKLVTKAREIPGLKTIDGFPEHGLRYRLCIDPAASAEKPARLLIWLHPSGGSMNNVIEAMAPQFAKDGYALVVFTQKDYLGWTGADADALMTHTLPDIAKIKGVDVKKPVLIGFSAGGQIALQMWESHPDSFGGMVLDAAYPLDVQAFAKGQVAPLTLPKNDAIKSCPVFALVGGADGGSNLWKAVEKCWRDAKIPLTLHIIPGKAHTWLIDKTEGEALNGWLKDVAAGKLPSGSNEPSAKPKAPVPGDTEGPSIKV